VHRQRFCERSISPPHRGQWVGGSNGTESSGRRSSWAPVTSGITSPARRTKTVSPARTLRRTRSSKLCSVAEVTITPPTCTGSSTATGVITPVRPTCTSIRSSVVVRVSAGNLYATPHRGARLDEPAAARSAGWSALMTAPSTP
jgi:hypothetical protein